MGERRVRKRETQSFYNDFFRIFGVRRESVARYEERVEELDDTTEFISVSCSTTASPDPMATLSSREHHGKRN